MAAEQGFLNTAVESSYQLLPDYTIPLLGETAVSTVAAGLIGALLVGLLVVGLAKMVKNN